MMKVAYKRDEHVAERMESCILKVLAYFSIFDYPLKADEIKRFLDPYCSIESFEVSLDRLVAEQSVFQIDDFYLLCNDLRLVMRRKEGNLRAAELLPKAMKIGKFLSRFPYVRGIGISGGLSKMYAHENADFDFFIITKADRLWIARTFMHLFKKLTFLTGKEHFYCMNYYLDEKSLALQDRNMYTAIETITLLPVSGNGIKDFFNANQWVGEWFGDYSAITNAYTPEDRKPLFKRLIEWLLNNRMGNWLDSYLLKLTTRRWKKKEEHGELNYEGKEMALVTGKHFAWSNPDSFQERIISLYNKKIAELHNNKPGYFERINLSFGKK